MITIQTIAQALGITRQAATRRAGHEGWPARRLPSKHGKPTKVYDPAALPIDVKEALARLSVIDATPPCNKATAVPSWEFTSTEPTEPHPLTPGARPSRAPLPGSGTAGFFSSAPALDAGAAEAAAVILSDRVGQLAAEEAKERRLVACDALPEQPRSRLEARVAVVQMFECYHATRGGGLVAAQRSFVADWRAGRLAVDGALARVHLSQTSLDRWQKALEAEGPIALAGKYGNRAGSGAIDAQPEMRDWMVGFLTKIPHAKAERLHEGLAVEFRSKLVRRVDASGEHVLQPARVPSLRRVQDWLTRYRAQNKAAVLRLANPDSFRSRFQVAFGSRSESVLRLNQLWEMDASPVDVMTTDGRCAVIGVVDVYSRRGKLLVSKTSTAVAIGLALRRAILDWGVPESVKSDNGADFIARHVRIALAGLDVQHVVCDPFTPEQKPHIERFLGTFMHGPMEIAAGYIGHSVADRKAIESRKSFAERQGGAEPIQVGLSSQRLQEVCDQWCEAVYHRRGHASLAGQSPLELALAWDQPVRRIGDVRALDILLAEAPEGRTREVGKKGLRVAGNTYIAPELGAHVRETVLVRYDPDGDAGRVVVYSTEGEFLCVAECPEMTGVSRSEIAAKAKAAQKAFIQAAIEPARAAARALRNQDLLKLILEDAVERAENVVPLPTASVPHRTPAIEQAATAARALERMGPTQRPERMVRAARRDRRATLARLEAEAAAAPAPRVNVHELTTSREKHAYWKALERRVAAGEPVDARDQHFFGEWPMNNRYFAMMEGADEEGGGLSRAS